jgi:hypothetical protein
MWSGKARGKAAALTRIIAAVFYALMTYGPHAILEYSCLAELISTVLLAKIHGQWLSSGLAEFLPACSVSDHPPSRSLRLDRPCRILQH